MSLEHKRVAGLITGSHESFVIFSCKTRATAKGLCMIMCITSTCTISSSSLPLEPNPDTWLVYYTNTLKEKCTQPYFAHHRKDFFCRMYCKKEEYRWRMMAWGTHLENIVINHKIHHLETSTDSSKIKLPIISREISSAQDDTDNISKSLFKHCLSLQLFIQGGWPLRKLAYSHVAIDNHGPSYASGNQWMVEGKTIQNW